MTIKDVLYIPQFLPRPEADRWLVLAASFPWIADSDSRSHVCYGKSYNAGGKPQIEHPFPSTLMPLVKLVAEAANKPVNFVQCHRMNENGIVLPHRDPAKMVVPMLTLGHTRTFRVGGKMPQVCYRMRQSQRKLTDHLDFVEVVMGHGDLLIFTGGAVVHSMVPAKDDKNFNPNGFEFRYSLLFRWTTDAMREFGPGDKARKAGHDKQYASAVQS
jgi:hypothetical protein